MPKMKTHKGLAARVKLTGRGKMLRHRAGRRHLNTGKSAKRMRQLRKTEPVPAAVEKTLRRLLPYA